MRRCSKCGETKPLDEFARSKRRSDGLSSACKPCANAYARRYYHENHAEQRAKKLAYAERNREHIRIYLRDWKRRWRESPEVRAQLAAESKAWREANPGYHREWEQRNIDKERERARKSMRASRNADPQRHREARQRYRQRNAEAIRKREREKTYARRAKQPYSKELAVLMASLVLQPCAYCGATENITIDHIVPLSRDGRHEASNLAPACLSCNCSKCDRLLSEWNGREAA